MNQIIVRYWPPYTNGSKETPVTYFAEAIKLRDWFRSMKIMSEVIFLEITEVRYGDDLDG